MNRGRAVLVEAAPRGGAILPSKPRRGAEARLTMWYLDLHGSSRWWWLDDIFAGLALGGQFPEIVRAVEFDPIGIREQIRPVRLPTGRTVDVRDECLVQALIEERRRAESDPTLACMVPMLKRLGVVVPYGNRGRIDRATVRRHAESEVLFLDQVLAIESPHPEAPGPHFDPLIAGLVTARVRLEVCRVIGSVRSLGGQVLHVSTDGVVVAVTQGGEPVFVAAPGGPIRKSRVRGFHAIPIPVIEEILTSSGANWRFVAGHDQATLAYVCGTQKVIMVTG